MSQPQLSMRRDDLEGLPPLTVPAGVTLRLATAADAPGLAACLSAAFADPAWDEERVFAALLHAPEVKATFIAEVGGTVAATASLAFQPQQHGDIGVLHWVARHPGQRSGGLGSLVSLAVLHAARGLGLVASSLLTDDHRLPAIRIYLRLGFHPFLCHRSHPARWRAILPTLA